MDSTTGAIQSDVSQIAPSLAVRTPRQQLQRLLNLARRRHESRGNMLHPTRFLQVLGRVNVQQHARIIDQDRVSGIT